MLEVYVDGDACPVKDEVFRVAKRHGLRVFVVSQGPLRVPDDERVEAVRVGRGFDAADNWIAERIAVDDIAITADIPLADRCLKRGARVVGPDGREFTDAMIGSALASRELAEQLRAMGELGGGPRPFEPKHRSRFLARLEETIRSVQRSPRPPAAPTSS
jgi:uncharacterized protein YaiI (UPF0178 family)